MATYTENYNLEKPAQSDLYNIDVFNENADKIDEALGSKAANQSLAPIESTSTATRNYSIGQQFVYNGLLYEATAAIASGGTITPGSNCARTTVAEELSALNDSLTTVQVVAANTTYISNNWLSLVKIGRIVNISGRFTVATQKPSGQSNYLFSVPAPQGAVVPIYVEGPSGHTPAIIINTDGLLTSNNAVPTGNYNVFISYVSAT